MAVNWAEGGLGGPGSTLALHNHSLGHDTSKTCPPRSQSTNSLSLGLAKSTRNQSKTMKQYNGNIGHKALINYGHLNCRVGLLDKNGAASWRKSPPLQGIISSMTLASPRLQSWEQIQSAQVVSKQYIIRSP